MSFVSEREVVAGIYWVLWVTVKALCLGSRQRPDQQTRAVGAQRGAAEVVEGVTSGSGIISLSASQRSALPLCVKRRSARVSGGLTGTRVMTKWITAVHSEKIMSTLKRDYNQDVGDAKPPR